MNEEIQKDIEAGLRGEKKSEPPRETLPEEQANAKTDYTLKEAIRKVAKELKADLMNRPYWLDKDTPTGAYHIRLAASTLSYLYGSSPMERSSIKVEKIEKMLAQELGIKTLDEHFNE